MVSSDFARGRFGDASAAHPPHPHLDKLTFTIMGVTPAKFFGPEIGHRFDVVVPFGAEPPRAREPSGPARRWLGDDHIAHLTPDQTVQAATVPCSGVAADLETTFGRNARREYRQLHYRESFVLALAAMGQSVLRDRYRQPLLAIMDVAALVPYLPVHASARASRRASRV